MVRVVGIDLAGSEKNDTGFCVLVGENGEKRVKTTILKSDDEIILQCRLVKPEIIAMDAPLSSAKNGFMRRADEELREYGALPHNLRGMAYLVERGIELGNRLKSEFKVIEVFNTATAKILGFHDKDGVEMQKKLAPMVKGLTDRIMSKDELDSVSAALAAYLHLKGRTEEVGDDQGRIAIPKV